MIAEIRKSEKSHKKVTTPAAPVDTIIDPFSMIAIVLVCVLAGVCISDVQ